MIRFEKFTEIHALLVSDCLRNRLGAITINARFIKCTVPADVNFFATLEAKITKTYFAFRQRSSTVPTHISTVYVPIG